MTLNPPLQNLTQQHQQQQQQLQHQQQQQQQRQQSPQQLPQSGGQNGLSFDSGNMTLAGVLHYLQTEWRRWERDRNEWEIERAEMRARIALLEGERRSADNLKVDLSRRVKMLEFALRQERAKTSSASTSANPATGIPPNKLTSIQNDDAKDKEGSVNGSEGGSDEGAPSSNGIPLPAGVKAALAQPQPAASNGGPLPAWKMGVAAAGRDPKSRQRSRDYLKQCLQEISYLTSPGALNPLPNRPVVLPPQAIEKSSSSQSNAPPPSASDDHQPQHLPTQPLQPTILTRPRKSLSEHPPPSPTTGIPPSIQDQREKEAEVEAAAMERQREREAGHAKEQQQQREREEQERLERQQQQQQDQQDQQRREEHDAAQEAKELAAREVEAEAAAFKESTPQPEEARSSESATVEHEEASTPHPSTSDFPSPPSSLPAPKASPSPSISMPTPSAAINAVLSSTSFTSIPNESALADEHEPEHSSQEESNPSIDISSPSASSSSPAADTSSEDVGNSTLVPSSSPTSSTTDKPADEAASQDPYPSPANSGFLPTSSAPPHSPIPASISLPTPPSSQEPKPEPTQNGVPDLSIGEVDDPELASELPATEPSVEAGLLPKEDASSHAVSEGEKTESVEDAEEEEKSDVAAAETSGDDDRAEESEPVVKTAKAEDNLEGEEEEEDEEGRATAVYRPQDKGEWRDALKAAGASIKPSPSSTDDASTSSSVQDPKPKRSGATTGSSRDEDDLTSVTLPDETDFDFDDDDDDDVKGKAKGRGGKEEEVGQKALWVVARTAKSHLASVRALAFIPSTTDGNDKQVSLASASEDCTAKFWRFDIDALAQRSPDLAPIKTYHGHTGPILSLLLLPSSSISTRTPPSFPSPGLLVTASADATIRIWDVPEPGHTLYSTTPSSDSHGKGKKGERKPIELVGHTDAVWGLARVSLGGGPKGGERLVSVGADGFVKVWDLDGLASSEEGERKVGLVGNWGRRSLNDDGVKAKVVPTCVCAVPGQREGGGEGGEGMVAVGWSDAVVVLYRVEGGEEVRRFATDETYDGLPETQINAIAFHPTKRILITAHEDKLIRFVDVNSGEILSTLLAHSDGVASLTVQRPSSETTPPLLISGGHDASSRVWDISFTSPVPSSPSSSSPDDATLPAFPPPTLVQEFTLHRKNKDSGVLALAVRGGEGRGGGDLLATGGADGTIRVLEWHESKGKVDVKGEGKGKARGGR